MMLQKRIPRSTFKYLSWSRNVTLFVPKRVGILGQCGGHRFIHLLKAAGDGNFTLTDFSHAEKKPPYAILSHTWGRGEVSHKDLIDEKGQEKEGFAKIRFCATQAAADGLQYFWVDTCCIDKTNSVELTYALNSMYRWYRDSIHCYVYMEDVETRDVLRERRSQEAKWHDAFQHSRWFTRGWTLQELLAPRSIHFYGRNGRLLGDKNSLEAEICNTTGIDPRALRGEPLSTFSIEERFSWATERQTSRSEDAAYSLLGLFDVSMPVIYGEGKRKAMNRLRSAIKDHGDQKQSGTSRRAAPFLVPFERNSRFTGRDEEMKIMEQRLATNDAGPSRLAVTGVGGIGKTQLVAELVHRIREKDKSRLIIWIPMNSMEACDQAFREAAHQLGLTSVGSEREDYKQLVSAYLDQDDTGTWLLVFDSTEDIDMWTSSNADNRRKALIDYLPKSRKGSIIFTTRGRSTADRLAQSNILDVGELKRDIAMDLLRKRLEQPGILDDMVAPNALLERLACLPLAIVQASAYMNETGVTISEYLSLLDKQDVDTIRIISETFDEEQQGGDVQNPIAKTWLVSFEQIKRHHPLAFKYLSFMACLCPKDIPQALLPTGPSRKEEIEAIRTLRAYAFVSRRAATASLYMHRLVHTSARSWLQKEGKLPHWIKEALEHVAAVFPEIKHKNRAEWRRYAPHAAYALGEAGGDMNSALKADLGWKYGRCQWMDGHYEVAEGALRAAVEHSEMAHGKDHKTTMDCLSSLSRVLEDLGKHEEAEQVNKRALLGFEQSLGPDHPDTLTSMVNLASLLSNRGRHRQAEELNRRALARRELLGSDHPTTLACLSNLARALGSQGKYLQAEMMHRGALSGREQVLGEDHPRTLSSMTNLAFTLGRQGKYKEAEEIGRQALSRQRKVLGADHPETLKSINNLAAVLGRQGRYLEAEELNKRATRGYQKIQGADHPDTLVSLCNSAYLQVQLGQLDEATALYRRACSGFMNVLKLRNPAALRCQEYYPGLTKVIAQQADEDLNVKSAQFPDNSADKDLEDDPILDSDMLTELMAISNHQQEAAMAIVAQSAKVMASNNEHT